MRLTSLVLATWFLVPPIGAAAQSAALPPAHPDQAIALIKRAELLQQRTELPAKARLYEEAARLFGRHDPRASASLRTAAVIQHELRKSARALELFERAAELAAARGDPSEAADTYVQALFIALEINARGEARRFIDRALALTNSPAMPEAARLRILRRLSQPAASLRGSLPRWSYAPS